MLNNLLDRTYASKELMYFSTTQKDSALREAHSNFLLSECSECTWFNAIVEVQQEKELATLP